MNESVVPRPGQSLQSVWSPGFSRWRALNEKDLEHFENRGVSCVLPAKAGTPYLYWSVLGAILLLFTLLSPYRAASQTNKPPADGLANRYLFILDTSRAMKPREQGTLQAMQDLLASGLGGQLRRGDTIGVWTYNEELNAGRFPLQLWTPETHRSVAIRILTFLNEQKYEKRGSL